MISQYITITQCNNEKYKDGRPGAVVPTVQPHMRGDIRKIVC